MGFIYIYFKLQARILDLIIEMDGCEFKRLIFNTNKLLINEFIEKINK